MLLTNRRVVRSTLAPAYNKEGENGGEEEEDAVRMLLNRLGLRCGDDLQLEHNQPNNKPNQSTITILTTVNAMGPTDIDQSITKWILMRVSVEVVSEQTSRGHISDEENEVEEGGNYL